MPARNVYHEGVRKALQKDGWLITHDPLRLSWGGKDMYVDLGAEQLLAAEKGGRRIAVEIKSFLGDSVMEDLENAIGQFAVYRAVLAEIDPDRTLHLAVPIKVLQDLFDEPLGKLLLQHKLVTLVAFDPQAEALVQWLP
jgi:hypothetical protein